MKSTFLHLIITFFVFTLCSQNIYAQDSLQWHIPKGAKARLGKGNIREIAFSPDGKILAAATDIGIWIYDTNTYQEVALLGAHTESIKCIDFNSEGSILASGSGKNVVLWNMSDYTQKAVIEGDHDRDVLCVAFSPDGKTIASGIQRRETYLWDVETGMKKATFSIVTRSIVGVEFSPDGQSLLIEGTDRTRSKTISLSFFIECCYR